MPPKHLNFFLICGLVSFLCYTTYRLVRPVAVVADAVQLIDRFYVEPVDTNELVTAAMKGITNELDPNTDFITSQDYEQLQDSINQEFAGIGILIEQPGGEGPIRVITPLVGSPALEAGFRPDDRIVAVAGVDVTDTELREVSQLLRGPIETEVAVTVRRDEEMETLTVRRDTIRMESVIGDYRSDQDRWVYRLADDKRIAYVRLTTFGDKTVGELERVFADLDDRFTGLILDVRGNAGGLLETAIGVCDMFIEDGRIVSTKTRGGVLAAVSDATPGVLVDPRRPMVVLIDGNSASASEIVAACLQDHGRAVVVGSRSYGKGTVQDILPLQSGRSALRLTVAHYYRPSDHNIHRTSDAKPTDEWGVIPNEGMIVAVDETQSLQIYTRMQRASFPHLDIPIADSDNGAGDDPGKVVGDQQGPDSAPEPPAIWDIPAITGDPQLDRAIQLLWHEIGQPTTNTQQPALPVAA